MTRTWRDGHNAYFVTENSQKLWCSAQSTQPLTGVGEIGGVDDNLRVAGSQGVEGGRGVVSLADVTPHTDAEGGGVGSDGGKRLLGGPTVVVIAHDVVVGGGGGQSGEHNVVQDGTLQQKLGTRTALKSQNRAISR